MKKQNYFIGLDIGTNSVGYAVADEQYTLCKFKGEPMWGVTLFDEASSAVARRGFRSARRRLDRRQQRVRLVQALFAKEIAPIDEGFFKRIKASYLYPETEADKVRIFDTYEMQKEYTTRYPTIHHLIVELIKDPAPHDARLVYLACAWLVAHRGHFLFEVDQAHIDEVTDFKAVYQELADFIRRDNFPLPWDPALDLDAVADALKAKKPIKQKMKALGEALFGEGRPIPKQIDAEHEFHYEQVIRLLCGGKVDLKTLFGKDAYADLEERSVALSFDDEKLESVLQSIGDDEALIRHLKRIYDWSVLADVLKAHGSISEAKVAVYEQHQKDLKTLKYFIKKYLPGQYSNVFRSSSVEGNYVTYIGKALSLDQKKRIGSSSREEFCKYICALLANASVDEADREQYGQILSRLKINDFMPKQVDGDNRVIPYQLYLREMEQILQNAKAYLPTLCECDADGLTGAEKLLSVFRFRVPYYVGPLKEKGASKYNHWMVRRAQGTIYPWNFEDKVDLDQSEANFIARMTNSCTYLPGEDVLPKNSLIYCAFEVLNEINNIKINGEPISVEVKQALYNEVFLRHQRVTPKHIQSYLISNGVMRPTDSLSGLDDTVRSSLKPYLQFRKLVDCGTLSYSEVEQIINRATYSEDRTRFSAWLKANYAQLSTEDVQYIASLKLKDFGRLSKKLLCEVGSVDPTTGEYATILRTMWETNHNFMELLSGAFGFQASIDAIVKEYYDCNPRSISERLDEMRISNAVKRPIIRTLDILKDVVKVQGHAPEKIFIEMARGATEEQKGKRTSTRLKQLQDLYAKVKDEDIRELQAQLDGLGDSAHNQLQSDKLFLYFIQLGKCLYTNQTIDLASVLSGDGAYNIEHIYPRSCVKDDSVINNEILVDSKANGDKGDRYPIDPAIQSRMRGYWNYLHEHGLISTEKLKRLTRTTPFTEAEKMDFVNRQLVETRQSTKAVAMLLKELYPDTEIVYVKAGLVSDFRQQFDLLKSRAVNDLHHAKDAYLNLVVGNVWSAKFNRQFWREQENHNANPKEVFTHRVVCHGKIAWNGAPDKDRVLQIVKKNAVHMTMYSYYKHSGQNGGFFDQNPLPAKEGKLIPLKKDRPTNRYGGYDSPTVSGFVLARYTLGKRAEVSLVPLKLIDMERFLKDPAFASAYIARELGEKAKDIEFPFPNRILKIYSMLSLDGVRFCIRGKASTNAIGLMNLTPFLVAPEMEAYIKAVQSLYEKHKKNESLVYDPRFDRVSKEKNEQLYAEYQNKLSVYPYNKLPSAEGLLKKLRDKADVFATLDVFQQCNVLLQLQGLFGRAKQADLSDLKEGKNMGLLRLSLQLSNWKKSYTDVRLIDRSASGLFEKRSDINLLDLL